MKNLNRIRIVLLIIAAAILGITKANHMSTSMILPDSFRVAGAICFILICAITCVEKHKMNQKKQFYCWTALMMLGVIGSVAIIVK